MRNWQAVVLVGAFLCAASAPLLRVADGGTGANTAIGARANLGAAKSGDNSDITSLTGLTTPLGSLYGGLGVSNRDISQFVVRPAGSETPIALADLAAQIRGLLSIQGSAVSGHLPIFGNCVENGGACQLHDSGLVPSIGYQGDVDPGPGQSIAQGYRQGSLGYNRVTEQWFYLFDETANAAVWHRFSPSYAAARVERMHWGVGQTVSGTPEYTANGIYGTTVNALNIVQTPGTFRALRAHFAQGPGVGKVNTVRLLTGSSVADLVAASAAPTATISCTVSGTLFDCPVDKVTGVHVTENQFWTIQIIVDPNAGLPTGLSSVAIEFTPDN